VPIRKSVGWERLTPIHWASLAERPGLSWALTMTWWLTPVHTSPAGCRSSQQPLDPSLLQLVAWHRVTESILLSLTPAIISGSSLLSLPSVSITSLVFSKPLTTLHGILPYEFFLTGHLASSFPFPFVTSLATPCCFLASWLQCCIEDLLQACLLCCSPAPVVCL